MAGQSPSDEENEAAWRGFAMRFIGCLIAIGAAVLALIIAVDPWDSGRFPSLGIVGVADDSQRVVNVSLGRDPQFDAAIFGNSHGQLLDPERLSRATRRSF